MTSILLRLPFPVLNRRFHYAVSLNDAFGVVRIKAKRQGQCALIFALRDFEVEIFAFFLFNALQGGLYFYLIVVVDNIDYRESFFHRDHRMGIPAQKVEASGRLNIWLTAILVRLTASHPYHALVQNLYVRPFGKASRRPLHPSLEGILVFFDIVRVFGITS